MAGNQLDGDILSSNLAGMSKNQLYDIMSQMKTLIDENHDQARDILVQNPGLTRGLFQAQIMLGMVQPPQTASDSRSTASQENPPPPLSNVQPSHSLPVQTLSVDQPYLSNSPRRQENLPVVPVLPSPNPHVLRQQQQQQQRGNQNVIQQPLMSSLHHLQMLNSQPPAPLQPPLSNTVPTHPPLPPQPRPPSMHTFPHQMYPPQMGPVNNFPHTGGPQMHSSQPMFHPGVRPPPPNMGPSFSQGQPPFSSQLPPQPVYQQGGGSQKIGMEFGQAGSSVQGERGSGWMPENAPRPHFPGPPQPQQQPPLPAAPFPPPAQTGPTSTSYQAPQAPPMTPDMEQALLQQVMSLTPEQITMLPPEQRSQVLQLQQIMRK